VSSLKVLLVIPVYNHGATLRDVVRRAMAVHPDVLVVDDGSTDGGAAGVEGLGARLVRHERNLGKGAAIMTAAREARLLGMTHLVTLDADGQHDPADVPRFLAAMREDPSAIVVGVRDFEGSGAPGSSRFGRKVSNFWLRVQTGAVLRDTQSGFRAYPVEVLEKLSLGERRYSFEIEVLVKAAWAGVPLREVPVSVSYPPGRISHFGAFADNARLSLLNTRLTMRAILPWPHRRIVPGAAGEGRVSILHPLRSLRLLLAEHASPRELALACSLGVFLGVLPLIGLHTMAILVAAGFLRLNRVAAVTASQICMPPFVPALAIEAGYFLRHGRFLTEISLRTLGHEGLQRVWEWFLGSLVLAPALALVVGGLVYLAAAAIRRTTRVPA
jgi:uncharacterized protein (DUF2062 family)